MSEQIQFAMQNWSLSSSSTKQKSILQARVTDWNDCECDCDSRRGSGVDDGDVEQLATQEMNLASIAARGIASIIALRTCLPRTERSILPKFLNRRRLSVSCR